MSPGLPAPFPDLEVGDDRNPAIRLFGKRFINEQGAVEILAEFLAVIFCDKRVEKGGQVASPLPRPPDLARWPARQRLLYRPPVKLNLKLFAFLAASRVDTRHEVHVEQYRRLARRLTAKIRTNDGDAQEPVGWLEELLRGFQGAGFNRAWCAQTFFPLSKSLLTQETLWNETVAKREPAANWLDSVVNFRKYFSVSRHRFLARGGELLYLQLCNALAADRGAVGEFVRGLREAEMDCISEEEADPESLHAVLQRGLEGLKGQPTSAFDRLVDTIEDLDPDTTRAANPQREDEGWLACEWCPRESWKEGYLFAVELSRVLGASLGPLERLELMTTGCALQVLRSLCAQSARYAETGGAGGGGALGYAWLFAPPEGASRQLRLASQRNLQAVQGLIQKALRTEDLRRNAQGDRVPVDKLYREADTKYGHKLFLSMGKKLGLIVPQRGPGARFVMTDEVLQYLVLALLRPGERCTYDDFLRRLYLHYGIAVQGDPLSDAALWSGIPANSSIQPANGAWLALSLRAGGFLFELSDACSIVQNTYRAVESQGVGV